MGHDFENDDDADKDGRRWCTDADDRNGNGNASSDDTDGEVDESGRIVWSNKHRSKKFGKGPD